MRVIITLVVIIMVVGCNEATNQLSPTVTTAPEVVVNESQQNGVSGFVQPTIEQTNNETEESNSTAAPQAESRTSDEPIELERTQIKRETRALWSRLDSYQRRLTKRDIEAIVTKVDEAHLNVILFKVYDDGVVQFEPSHSRFPDSQERLTNQSSFSIEGYSDALSYLLAIRDERRADADPGNDFEVHAWLSVMRGGERNSGWPAEDKTKPYALHALFPEFKLKHGAYYRKEDEGYTWHDKSNVHNPKFRAYMINLIAGLVEDYDVDGVHLDHIRATEICFNNEGLDYPGTGYDYPGCQEDYKAWTRATYGREYTLWDDTDGNKRIRDGDSGRIAAWQEQAVTTLVKSIHGEVLSIRPDMIISVASVRNNPSPEARKQSVDGQIAWEWLDEGWVDAVFVTAYTPNTQWIIDMLERYRAAVPNEKRRLNIFPGLLTYDLDTKEEFSDQMVKQVETLMYGYGAGPPLEPTAKGVALFREGYFSQTAARTLGQGPFQEPALPFWGERETTVETISSP